MTHSSRFFATWRIRWKIGSSSTKMKRVPHIADRRPVFSQRRGFSSEEKPTWYSPHMTKAPTGHDFDAETKMSADPHEWGRIHSIESFSTVDGEGIRYMIFIQGCHFRCIYCSNPDSWNIYGGTISSVTSIREKIKRCLPYLLASGGGVTVSGGDPLVQPEFTSSIFQNCREMGLSTALDTTGFAPREAWDEVLPHTDYVFMSVKGTTEESYRKMSHSRKGFSKMLEFAEEVGRRGIPLTLRYPLVPAYTDSREDIDRLISFAKGQKSLACIEILPYHTLGVYKWHELNLKYPLEGVRTPTKQEVADVVQIIKDSGIKVVA